MSHTKYTIDKLSHRLPGLLPDYLREEAPIFESFIKAYFEFLESEILTLESQSDLDGIALEDGDGSLLLEPATVSPSPDALTSKIINERTATNSNSDADPFLVGEYIYGETSGSVSKIKVIVGNVLFLESVIGIGFSKGEKITGRDGGQTGIVKNYKENSVTANNRLLDYSDIDHTTEQFIEHFANDFVPALDISSTKNKRLTIKHISELYQKKGTEDSIKFLMRILFGQDAEVRYPDNETLYLSKSDYNEERRLVVKMDRDVLPEATDKITKYDTDARTILAESVIESVVVKDVDEFIYSCHIKDNHYGVFSDGDAVTLLDRDGKTTYTGQILGIISGINTEGSSVYIEHDDDGIITLESGLPASYDGDYEYYKPNLETTVGGALTLELDDRGAMYGFNDLIAFSGGPADSDAVLSKSIVDDVSYGPVTHIYIEDGGINYDAGDLVVFEDTNTYGGGAEAVIGSVGDEILLENIVLWGQFEITATAGQTLFNGVDDNGNRIFFNDNLVDVYVDGLIQTPITDYSFKNDRVTFVNPLAGGELVEIYTSYNRVVYEDDGLINYESSDQRIRRIQIKYGGSYAIPPKVYPGGYIYMDDISGYEVGEQITGGNNGATATILRLDTKNGRLVVKRLSTDTGTFVNGESITGGTTLTNKFCTTVNVASGTGAKLYAYGENIGAVEQINLQNQGYKFSEHGRLDSSSVVPMLITTPTATPTRDVVITGQLSGATAKILSYDADRHILRLVDLDGYFLENEKVIYNSVDNFEVLKFSPFNARGNYAGEGIMQEQLLGTAGTLDQDSSNIQDGNYYQTHSYVVRIGESINRWRSALKDLIHPSGHIFFGEVAIKNNVSSSMDSIFRPLIVIKSHVTYNIELENQTRNNYLTIAERDDPSHLLYEDGSKVINEFSYDPTAVTKHEHISLFYLDDIDMSVALREAGQPTPNINTTATLDVSTVTNPAGVDLGALSEYYDTSHKNRHVNIVKIQTYSVAPVQHSPRLDDAMSVLNLVRSDDNNDYLVIQNEQRPSDQGKVFTSNTFIDEVLILEDGGRIELEEEVCKVRMEPSPHARVKGDFGDVFILESGETLRLESATTVEPVHYFTTERSIELCDKFIYTEDNHRIVFEDEVPISKEENAEHHHVSFVPFGSTYGTINNISRQQTYNISYYLKDETDNDDILLESGTGSLLSEESKPEGLRFYDMEHYLPKMYVAELPLHERKRTNITYNAYVKSA